MKGKSVSEENFYGKLIDLSHINHNRIGFERWIMGKNFAKKLIQKPGWLLDRKQSLGGEYWKELW